MRKKEKGTAVDIPVHFRARSISATFLFLADLFVKIAGHDVLTPKEIAASDSRNNRARATLGKECARAPGRSHRVVGVKSFSSSSSRNI